MSSQLGSRLDWKVHNAVIKMLVSCTFEYTESTDFVQDGQSLRARCLTSGAFSATLAHCLKLNKNQNDMKLARVKQDIGVSRPRRYLDIFDAEVLVYGTTTCPSLSKHSEKLVAVTPLNKNKKVRNEEFY
ncbi:hypothetical protein Tco_1313349 [Tanacetum coccineum]